MTDSVSSTPLEFQGLCGWAIESVCGTLIGLGLMGNGCGLIVVNGYELWVDMMFLYCWVAAVCEKSSKMREGRGLIYVARKGESNLGR